MAIDKEFLTGVVGDNEKADEIIQAIIDAHMETVNGINAQIEEYKPQAEQTHSISEEIASFKAGTDYRAEYERLKAENDTMRENSKKEIIFAGKAEAFCDCLSRAGVPHKYHGVIVKASKDYIEALEADGGKVRDLGATLAYIRDEWDDFIPARKR